MRYGYWLPVFGGWLRNVENENMTASWDYVKRLAQRSEAIGYDLTLIAELLLNDIKGINAPSLDAWSTAAALAAVTERLELMVAVRPSFHPPAILAKQAANIDRISNGRLALNVVSAWWKDEARRYGAAFDEHDDRYARTTEWLDVVDGAWSQASFSYHGRFYDHNDIVLEPKPVSTPERRRPTIYAGGESEAAKTSTPRRSSTGVFGSSRRTVRAWGWACATVSTEVLPRIETTILRASTVSATASSWYGLCARTRTSARSAHSWLETTSPPSSSTSARARPDPVSVASTGLPSPRASARAMFPDPMKPTCMRGRPV